MLLVVGGGGSVVSFSGDLLGLLVRVGGGGECEKVSKYQTQSPTRGGTPHNLIDLESIIMDAIAERLFIRNGHGHTPLQGTHAKGRE